MIQQLAKVWNVKRERTASFERDEAVEWQPWGQTPKGAAAASVMALAALQDVLKNLQPHQKISGQTSSNSNDGQTKNLLLVIFCNFVIF